MKKTLQSPAVALCVYAFCIRESLSSYPLKVVWGFPKRTVVLDPWVGVGSQKGVFPPQDGCFPLGFLFKPTKTRSPPALPPQKKRAKPSSKKQTQNQKDHFRGFQLPAKFSCVRIEDTAVARLAAGLPTPRRVGKPGAGDMRSGHPGINASLRFQLVHKFSG